MRILVDTHALLWWIHDDPRLSSAARKTMSDPASELVLSVASIWEIVIKFGSGQLKLGQPPADYLPPVLKKYEIGLLNITGAHAFRTGTFPQHHKDPFDRIIIAQAIEENLPILTSDNHFRAYPVSTVW